MGILESLKGGIVVGDVLSAAGVMGEGGILADVAAVGPRLTGDDRHTRRIDETRLGGEAKKPREAKQQCPRPKKKSQKYKKCLHFSIIHPLARPDPNDYGGQ